MLRSTMSVPAEKGAQARFREDLNSSAPSMGAAAKVTNAGSSPTSTTSSSSPLQLFTRAKKKINDIYAEVGEYVTDSGRFLNSAAAAESVDKGKDRIADYQRKVSHRLKS